MIVYVEHVLLNLDGLEIEILTAPKVQFVFSNQHILDANINLLQWIYSSPLKEKFYTHVRSQNHVNPY
ncbi:hypothetical protein CN918_32480 [Priestia megaterium]|nr:hypothetical protein CN918_32480 [Priestia megaterium]